MLSEFSTALLLQTGKIPGEGIRILRVKLLAHNNNQIKRGVSRIGDGMGHMRRDTHCHHILFSHRQFLLFPCPRIPKEASRIRLHPDIPLAPVMSNRIIRASRFERGSIESLFC